MTVRWQAGDSHGIPSGYTGADVPGDVRVPPCGLEDVDRALFELFEREIGFQVRTKDDGKNVTKKVPVFFGMSEKWASVKRRAPLRDDSGTLILPIIAIYRTAVTQKSEQDELGRGVNQATGQVVFKRRLSTRDRSYQNLINKFNIKNQSSSPVTGQPASPNSTLRVTGIDSYDPDALAGGFLIPKLDRNVWEFLAIPTPQFYTATYEVTFWTQYMTEMNSMIQRLMAAKLQQLPAFKITTRAGYWFVAYLDGDYKPEENKDERGEESRIIKMSFVLNVRAYTVAPDESGMTTPLRRYYSVPDIAFEIDGEVSVPKGSSKQSPSTLADGIRRWDTALTVR